MKIYTNDTLGFSITYPDHWTIVPAAWIKQYMGRASATSEKLAYYLSNGSQPFLVAQDPSVPPGLAIPAVKCQAYDPAAIAAVGGIRGVLSLVVSQSTEAFPDFEVLECVPECVVAGVKGARMVASMTVLNPEGEAFHGMSEFYFLPTQAVVFMVAVTATSDMAYRPEQELMGIIRSIRLNQA
ncbi:MAG: hypothetical protein R3F38_15140 [Gammaproteobacteria bacterium]